MTVERLLEEVSSDELTEWMAFWELEPFGQQWMQSGILTSIVANLARSETQAPFTPSDFIPPYEGDKEFKEAYQERQRRELMGILENLPKKNG